MEKLDEIVTDFLVESHEALDQLDEDLLLLEQDPECAPILGRIFRVIHTIKGTCGFLGFHRLERLTHQGENLLSKLRDGELVLTEGMTSTLLRMVDGVREILATVEHTGEEGEEEYADVVAELTAHLGGGVSPEPDEVGTELEPGVILLAPLDPEEAFDPPEPAAVVAPEPPKPAPVARAQEATQRAEPARKRPPSTGRGVADTSIRVDVALLEKVMNLVGELVLARNQFLQFAGTQGDSTFLATAQRLNLITTELQEAVMKTRMQPIGSIWRKFPRVVRDLSRACGKQVRIDMEGEETELDRTLIEAIKDPMTHIIRNSVDHGIESCEERAAAGKAAEGVIAMRAFHEGGQVNIQITDDGGGIDVAKVREKAIQRGVISVEEAERMSDRDLVSLVFAPGFSTAQTVTNVSGRGVGMDVVRTSIEKIGGSVDVQSELGSGTTLRIKIPLTLAIIPALVVTCRGDRFAIPQVSLLELVRVENEAGSSSIEHVQGVPVYRLRGNLLPLVYLDELLDGEGPRQPSEEEAINIVVLQADDRVFGLVVDQISDTEEIVVKPLGQQLKGVHAFSGATIMGDGRVALILDVLGMARLADVVSEGDSERPGHSTDERDSGVDESQREPLLLFDVGDGQQMAMPLGSVDRLDEFPLSAIEEVGGMLCVQHRGEVMPLVDLSAELGGATVGERMHATEDPGQVQVVVYGSGRTGVGVVVGHILDILDHDLSQLQRSRREHVLGVAILRERVTEVLDVTAFIERILIHA